MDIIHELTRMADLELNPNGSAMNLQEKTTQWQNLFGYSHEQALQLISSRSTDFAHRRTTISSELWDEIKEDWVGRGFDKDAYEHYLDLEVRGLDGFSSSSKTATLVGGGGGGEERSPGLDDEKPRFLMRLEGEVADPDDVAAMIGVRGALETTCDIEDSGVRFCFLTNAQRQMVERKVFPKPTFISLGALPSAKDLDGNSQHPTLGIDSTLPQHRAESVGTVFEPEQTHYPVWYFFYGNLAKPEILSPRLGISEEDIRYTPAKVYGGRLGTWRNKYRALLNGRSDEFVDGSGFVVESKEVEDWLRAYETEAYEVVRCRMELEHGRIVPALTFRFALNDYT